MVDVLVLAFFCLLPPCLAFYMSYQNSFFEKRFQAELEKANIEVIESPKKTLLKEEIILILLLLISVPFFLLLIKHGDNIGLFVTFLSGFIGACLGAYVLLGKKGLLLIGILSIISFLVINNFPLLSSSSNFIAFFSALGTAYILHRFLSDKALIIFLIAFCVFDLFITQTSLFKDALDVLVASPMPALASLSFEGLSTIPTYNRLVINDFLLGGGDLVYAILVGSLLFRLQMKLKFKTLIFLVYLCLQTCVIVWAYNSDYPLPATVPGCICVFIILLYFYLNQKEPHQAAY